MAFSSALKCMEFGKSDKLQFDGRYEYNSQIVGDILFMLDTYVFEKHCPLP